MLTREFFDLVLPDRGLRCIAVPVSADPKDGFRHSFKQTNTEAADFAVTADARGLTVYFGCSTYRSDGERNEHGSLRRLGSNAVAMRSFWLDLDCGPAPKPYLTQAAALTALVAFVRALKLPAPLIVSSGRGIHAYWPMDADIEPDDWRMVATYLKAACKAQGLLADPARTADAASVLRPVGTTHRKGQPVTVTVLRDAGPTALAPFQAKLTDYLGALVEDGLPSAPAHALAAFSGNADLSAGMSFPAVYADRIADQCGIIGLVRQTKGVVDQPTWFHTLQVLAACEDGEEKAHEWSSGDPRYTHAETQAVYDRVKAFKPTTCEKLSDYQPAICSACPKWGKIKSPVGLGASPAPIAIMVTPQPPPVKSTAFGADDEDDDVPLAVALGMPFGYQWMTTEAPFAQLCYKVLDKDGQITWHAFCNTLFYPVSRLGDMDDGFSNEFEMTVKDGELRRFTIDTSTIAEGGAGLASVLGRFEITALPRMKPIMEHYLQSWMSNIRLNREALAPRHHFGWHGRDFLVGSTLLTPKGSTTAILKGIVGVKAKAMVPTGSLDAWKHVIDQAYNYPGQEALQFCVLLSFAAPLIPMFKQFGGVTAFAHSQGTGVGKTTAQRAGLAAWGDYEALQLADGQATEASLRALMGAYHNLPVLFDELTNQTNAAASKLVYDVSSGRAKERLTSGGDIRTNNSNWSTILMASGNNTLTEKLGQHRADAGAEIARLFEFTVRSKSRLTTAQANELFPQLADNYGHAGLLFADYLVKNYDRVEAVLLKVQAAFNLAAGVKQSERYWSALASAVLTACKLCAHLDLIRFDHVALSAWIVRQFDLNRTVSAATVSDASEQFGRMLADMWSGILVTNGEGDLRKNAPAKVVGRGPVGAMVGRAIIAQNPTETTVLFLNLSAIAGWCNKQGISAKEMMNAGVAAGWLSPEPARYSLGRGTNEYTNVTSPVRCWVIDPVKMGLDVGTPASTSMGQGS